MIARTYVSTIAKLQPFQDRKCPKILAQSRYEEMKEDVDFYVFSPKKTSVAPKFLAKQEVMLISEENRRTVK